MEYLHLLCTEFEFNFRSRGDGGGSGGNFSDDSLLISFSISRRFFTTLLSYSCAYIYQNISCALVNIHWI
jgi:hypothetical protein